MTEKRFTVIDHNEWSEGDIIYYDDGKEMGWMDVCDKLNELHEENQSLENHDKWQEEKYSELLDSFTNMKKKLQLVKKENEQLKQQDMNIINLTKLNNHKKVMGLMEECKFLKEENEELKKEAKHQQGQKQRLRNYLRQYLSIEEIREIANNDKWLSSEELEKGLKE